MWIVTANPEEQTRRSIYMLSRRTFRPAMFESFDAPDGIRTCSRREASNTAPQSLTLLNGRWTVDESKRLAAARFEGSNDDGDSHASVASACSVATPMRTNWIDGRNFLRDQTAELGTSLMRPSELARALFNTNEFLYVD